MSDETSLRAEVLAALLPLNGLPLVTVRRAADLINFVFGTLHPAARGAVGDWALHVQCAWRIDGPDGVVRS